MAEIADIKDRDSLEAWLSDQPREVSVWLAARAAGRSLPAFWQAVLSEDSAREENLTALPYLRALLISSDADLQLDYGIETAAHYAYVAAFAAAAPEADFVGCDFAYAAANAAFVASNNGENAELYDAVAATADYAAEAALHNGEAWQALRRDAEKVAISSMPDALPLWHYGNGPLAEKWRAIRWQVSNSEGAEDWQFWIDWYDAQLSGRTMLSDPKRTLDMLEQIALIDPETWDAGPETVNPIIREIRELHRLRFEVAALQAAKDAFLATRASQAQRSHNQPPDGLLDDQPELARQITIVWDSLDEARDELEQDAPDKGLLRAIAERLLSALTAIARYCGKVADTAVISAAKVGGGTVGTAILDHLANNGRLMQFAKDLLAYGAG